MVGEICSEAKLMVAVVCDDLLRFYVVNKVYNVLPTLNQFLDTGMRYDFENLDID